LSFPKVTSQEEVPLRTKRVVAVVGGMIVASAFVGALVGALTAAIVLSSMASPLSILRDPFVLLIGAIIGAPCAIVLGPIASFSFMRRVPLGRLFLETGVATVAAGCLGFEVAVTMSLALGIASIGFLGAGARLAWRYRSAEAERFVAG
jgi:hypothetical protein